MFIRNLDYLSPSITFYHKKFLSHTSIISGILSILSYIIIIGFAVYFSLDIFKRKNPKAFYYNRFIEDAGVFPFNASSLFHFINLTHTNMKIIDEGVDFTYFRIIGYNINFNIYVEDRNLSKYDHWLYGPCNNENDTVGISHLIKYDFFEKSACIKNILIQKNKNILIHLIQILNIQKWLMELIMMIKNHILFLLKNVKKNL